MDEQQVDCVRVFFVFCFSLMKFHYAGKHLNEMHTGNKHKLLENLC